MIAHRGASKERPENTLPAYALAVAQGADHRHAALAQAAQHVTMPDAAADHAMLPAGTRVSGAGRSSAATSSTTRKAPTVTLS